ncbi:tyrosine-type recombinase/integrase [Vannielia sp. SX4]|uniref:tyrosine-type recombinase/integrase n=1 Tax=Vannielia sp. SX4 TaxID=3463852 RepID=UPI004058F1FA
MRYDDMRDHVRDHFTTMLREFRERSAADGPASGLDMDALQAAQGLSEGDAGSWAAVAHAGGADGLLRAFCEARGIVPEPEGRARNLLLAELQKGYQEYISRALEHTTQFDTLSLEAEAAPMPRDLRETGSRGSAEPDALPLEAVLSRYFAELDRTQALAAKTESEKRDALALMAELTSSKPPAHMTKADAQEVKAALFKLPKNRSKNPTTRELPLGEALELPGVERIAARTMNVYLGHMQHFCGWAVNNGYAVENVFHGLRLKRTARSSDEGRKAFSADQLRLLFSHLTDADSPLVRKDVHKWPALIGMFTGLRLNEVAQLEVQDIELRDGVWCINVTPDGEDNKRLKNASSRRRVPVHDKLAAAGFLDFYEKQKAGDHSRMFPSLTYSPQNGYGRNAGRWFNERFLPELELGGQGLVFHCLRHTMITRLAQAGVAEPMVKALVGHSQTGVTFSTYFKEGFLPSQLQEAINRFDF